jgi:3-hydroxyisobutyrate dehydrogenase-like beta-hydroxyacid dehydrogenase
MVSSIIDPTPSEWVMGAEMDKRIGIIGLGRCGMPAAKRYIEEGYKVYGYARRPEVIRQFEGFGGQHVGSPSEVAKNAPVIIVMVLNDDQVIEVVTGRGGILEGAGKGSTVICMSTINRSNLENVADACAKEKVKFVDSPFTGGPARVEAGTITLIVGAPDDLVAEVRPIMEVIGQINVMGDMPGMGQAAKHCNQLLVTAIHGATIELILLAQKSGLDPKKVCEVIGSGIGGNDYFRLLAKGILEKTDSPGGMGQLWKDVNIVVNSGREYNLPLLVATASSQYFNIAVAQGKSEEDSARLFDMIKQMTEPKN